MTYDFWDDFSKSTSFCYEEIRKRKAAGGPGWEPDMSYTIVDDHGVVHVRASIKDLAELNELISKLQDRQQELSKKETDAGPNP